MAFDWRGAFNECVVRRGCWRVSMSMSRRIKAAVLVAALLAIAGVAPASGAPGGRSESTPAAERARYWTAARRAAAIPRDLVLDEQGHGYLRLPSGQLEPRGN